MNRLVTLTSEDIESLKRLYIALRYFYVIFFEDFLYDVFCIILFFFLAPIVLRHFSSLASIEAFFRLGFYAGVYEVILWPLPFLYTLDWHFRLILENFFDTLDAQLDVLSVKDW